MGVTIQPRAAQRAIRPGGGPGLPRIINRCKEYRLPEPLFEEFGDGFRVTIFRKVSNAFEKYSLLFEGKEVTETFMHNIEQVFAHCGMGVPFGQANVMEWLNCSKSKATNVMNTMKGANVIRKVTGFGPGKYEFVEM